MNETCDYLYDLGTQELSDVSETAKKRLDVNIIMEEMAQLKGEVKELIDKFTSGTVSSGAQLFVCLL